MDAVSVAIHLSFCCAVDLMIKGTGPLHEALHKHLNELLVVEIYKSPVWGDGEEEKVTLKGSEKWRGGKKKLLPLKGCYVNS